MLPDTLEQLVPHTRPSAIQIHARTLEPVTSMPPAEPRVIVRPTSLVHAVKRLEISAPDRHVAIRVFVYQIQLLETIPATVTVVARDLTARARTLLALPLVHSPIQDTAASTFTVQQLMVS